MKRRKLRYGEGFRVAFGTRRAQCAEMVIAPGGSEGGDDNRHRGADQWLLVISGSGVARVGTHRVTLKAGVLLLIERGEAHSIRNTGRSLLRTVNFYTPPAFHPDGEPRPAGRGGSRR